VCLTLAFAPACQSFYAYRPMTIVARDAETGQPVPGATVRVSYPLMHPSQAPYDSIDAAASDGVVHVQAAPAGPAGVLIEARAQGYLMEAKTVPVETVQAIQPAILFEDARRRPPCLTIDMYADPRPIVQLEVPLSFRGVIDVQIKPDAKAPHRPGLRCFTFAVPPTGKLELAGPPLLERVAPIDYRARYQNGQMLSRDAKGLEIGFFGLSAEGNHLTFLVGTRDEFEAKRREALAQDATPRGPAAMGRAPGGRHGGRGGHGQSDSTPAAGP
jgi:hypothetical protein